MTSSGSDDRRLAALQPPRRNRYYAGKTLSLADLEMEQVPPRRRGGTMFLSTLRPHDR